MYWAIRDVNEGYCVDTCAGGVFSGKETLTTWTDYDVFNNALTWTSASEAREVMRACEIAITNDCDVHPIDV